LLELLLLFPVDELVDVDEELLDDEVVVFVVGVLVVALV
jgi:hypothetical protein